MSGIVRKKCCCGCEVCNAECVEIEFTDWPGNTRNAVLDPITLPVIDYAHTEGCSVTGGYVYRGRAIPELTGHYLYADYCRGWLRSFRLSANGTLAMQRTWAGFATRRAVSFGQDGAGEVYLIADGKVWRIVRG